MSSRCSRKRGALWLTWVECATSGVCRVRICKDELASRVIHDVCVRLGVFLVVYRKKSVRLPNVTTVVESRTDVGVEPAENGTDGRILVDARVVARWNEDAVFRVL